VELILSHWHCILPVILIALAVPLLLGPGKGRTDEDLFKE
jgi:hypothetical protein